jgi:hypothetical protein
MNKLAKKSTVNVNRAPFLYGVDMATGLDATVTCSLNKPRHFQDIAESILCKKDDQQKICEMVSAITGLAILNHDVIHIHVDYVAHTQWLAIEVYPGKTVYRGHPAPIFRERISLKRDNPVEQLKTLEDKLIDLIAEAKDNAMGAC